MAPALAEVIRYLCKYDTLKGVRWSFITIAILSMRLAELALKTQTEGLR